MVDYAIRKLMSSPSSALYSWIVWWITSGVSTEYLRLEPPGDLHAFFTGDSFFVTCFASEHSGATRLTWQGPTGRDITVSHGRLYVEAVPENPLGLGLVLEDVKYKDSGFYTCSAVVDGVETRTRFQLVVHQSIVFWGTPKEQHGSEGNDYLLTCNVRSEPSAIISWYVNGSLILTGKRRTITEDGLYIRSLRITDAGNYTCRAFVVTPHISQMKDHRIQFDIHYRPVWHKPHMEITYGLVGRTAKLVCEAHAQPPPIFEWFRERTLLGNSRIYKITNSKWRSTLQVTIYDQNAFGNFQCVVSNLLGEVHRYIALFEGVYPSPPKLTVFRNHPGSFTIELTPFASDPLPVIEYRVQYRLQSQNWSRAKEQRNSTGNIIALPDLLFEEVYAIRSKAKNDIGYSNYSEEVSERTLGPVAETVLDSPGVSSLSNSGSHSSSIRNNLGYILTIPFTIYFVFGLPIWR